MARIALPLLVLALALLAVAVLEYQHAGAQTAPVSDADRTFAHMDAGPFLTCGSSKAGFMRCFGDTFLGPIRSDEGGYVQVAVAGRFACGLRDSGAVRCYGYRVVGGQLAGPAPPPTVPDGDRAGEPYTFSTISAGGDHVCGLLDSRNGQTPGLVKCWPATETDAQVPTDLQALSFGKLSAEGNTTCGLIGGGDDDGEARCFGRGATVLDPDATYGIPAALVDTPLRDISTNGNASACAVLRDAPDAGKLACWTTATSPQDTIATQAPTTGAFSSVSVGWDHACAVRTDGTGVCWGRGGNLQKPQVIPAALSSATFSLISAEEYHSCGLLDGGGEQVGGTIKCWGLVDEARLFEPDIGVLPYAVTDTFQHVPFAERDPLPRLKTDPPGLSSGVYSTCATTRAGGAVCFGRLRSSFKPIPSGVAQVVSAADVACILKDDGTVKCVGNNTLKEATPPDGVTFKRIDGKFVHFCGILDAKSGQAEGRTRCWGYGGQGPSIVPEDLESTTFSQVAPGVHHTCGVLDGQNDQIAGTVKCWGSPPAGQNAGQAIAPIGTFAKIGAGFYHNCGILDGQNGQTEGTIKCWGWNSVGQSTVPRALEKTVFTGISVMLWHSCGLSSIGRVYCWGNVAGTNRDYGQVAIPEKYRYATFAQISASRYHTCAVTPEGYAACWGADGQPAKAGHQVAQENGNLLNTGQADPIPPAPGVNICPGPRVTLSLDPDSILSSEQDSATVSASISVPALAATTIRLTLEPPPSSGLYSVADTRLTIKPGKTHSNGLAIILVDNSTVGTNLRLRVSGVSSVGSCPEQDTSTVTLTTVGGRLAPAQGDGHSNGHGHAHAHPGAAHPRAYSYNQAFAHGHKPAPTHDRASAHAGSRPHNRTHSHISPCTNHRTEPGPWNSANDAAHANTNSRGDGNPPDSGSPSGPPADADAKTERRGRGRWNRQRGGGRTYSNSNSHSYSYSNGNGNANQGAALADCHTYTHAHAYSDTNEQSDAPTSAFPQADPSFHMANHDHANQHTLIAAGCRRHQHGYT